nr:PREDICTED: cytotoxic T-lymphocyte protein 4-like isoform X1 [Lepisosteus oculatus]
MLSRLFLFYLCFGHLKAFQVSQPHRQTASTNGTVTFTCSYTSPTKNFSDVQVHLMRRVHNDSLPCAKLRNDIQKSVSCLMSEKEGSVTFNIFNFTHNDTDLYVCRVHRKLPLPFVSRDGDGTLLVFPEIKTEDTKPSICLDDSLLWILVGVAAFSIIYSISVTFACLKLKVSLDEEMDLSEAHSNGQVHLQAGDSPSRQKRRRGDPDANSEYMDMRKVQARMQEPSRDRNFNSQHFHI